MPGGRCPRGLAYSRQIHARILPCLHQTASWLTQGGSSRSWATEGGPSGVVAASERSWQMSPLRQASCRMCQQGQGRLLCLVLRRGGRRQQLETQRPKVYTSKNLPAEVAHFIHVDLRAWVDGSAIGLLCTGRAPLRRRHGSMNAQESADGPHAMPPHAAPCRALPRSAVRCNGRAPKAAQHQPISPRCRPRARARGALAAGG